MAATGNIAGDQLRSFIERVERMEEEKATITGDIREIFSEAKASGFDVKVMRQVVKLRKIDAQDRLEQEEILTLYLHALGMAPEPAE